MFAKRAPVKGSEGEVGTNETRMPHGSCNTCENDLLASICPPKTIHESDNKSLSLKSTGSYGSRKLRQRERVFATLVRYCQGIVRVTNAS